MRGEGAGVRKDGWMGECVVLDHLERVGRGCGDRERRL